MNRDLLEKGLAEAEHRVAMAERHLAYQLEFVARRRDPSQNALPSGSQTPGEFARKPLVAAHAPVAGVRGIASVAHGRSRSAAENTKLLSSRRIKHGHLCIRIDDVSGACAVSSVAPPTTRIAARHIQEHIR